MTKKTYLSRLADAAEKLFAGRSIEQYGAICHRLSQGQKNVEILLITSRDSGRWVIPKGWPMDRKLPHQVAEREAWEEAGVRGKARKKRFGYYTYLKVLDTGETVPSIVQVHLLEVAGLDERFPERGERQLQWFSPNEAAAHVREPELKSLLRMLETTLTPDK
ncbi:MULTISPECIES: NUDIX hydrolase [unclassified Rhizobium]|uniref:NUDIX hydrolase n=1 Tax=unclassified Rhizobium TaxID=2613769 RepID=UPI000EA9ECC8|nr:MULTISPECIES: NUDIX hydrolase [unclassified Rhizobium]AYG70021.1 NUDIX domain-containing protein [Rhizobium sp. CCGE531]AYG76397.1 NUDIX domain-containing protein [Rhizobium sp. CCGE532]